jgi:hypothetical protein
MPDWYPLLTAARYLGVAPWELVDQPAEWLEWALSAQSAEAEAARVNAGRKSSARHSHKKVVVDG